MVEGELQNIGPDLAKKHTRLRERWVYHMAIFKSDFGIQILF